jgi:hypothetical protein
MKQKIIQNRRSRIVNEFNCYRCKKPVRLKREDYQIGKTFHVMWINYKEYWAYLCPSCSLNLEDFLGVKWYKNEDLTAA